MNQILEGWKMVLKDYRHWKMIIKYPYDAFDCAVFFGNLAEPPNSLDDWVKEMKQPQTTPCNPGITLLPGTHNTVRAE